MNGLEHLRIRCSHTCGVPVTLCFAVGTLVKDVFAVCGALFRHFLWYASWIA